MTATNTTTTDVKMIEVESSNIHSIGYDTETSRLYIRFRDGMRLYRYDRVPPVMWIDFRLAKHINRFFVDQIKGYFQCVEIR